MFRLSTKQQTIHKDVWAGDIGLVKYFLDEHPLFDINFDISESSKSTLLHCAANMQHLDMVNLLLSCNPQIDKFNSQGQTALIIAAQKGNTAIAQRLIEKG